MKEVKNRSKNSFRSNQKPKQLIVKFLATLLFLSSNQYLASSSAVLRANPISKTSYSYSNGESFVSQALKKVGKAVVTTETKRRILSKNREDAIGNGSATERVVLCVCKCGGI